MSRRSARRRHQSINAMRRIYCTPAQLRERFGIIQSGRWQGNDYATGPMPWPLAVNPRSIVDVRTP